MNKNYTVYHLHTDRSLLDSCTNYKLYIDKAVELGQTAIAFSEHGNIYNWIEKKMYANEKGLKYIHACEVYLTESLDEKVRDNYHTILIAKNYDGVKEINTLIDLSTTESHFYYKPRITFDEFFNISNNVIKISACLASPLNKYPSSANKLYDQISELNKEWQKDIAYERNHCNEEYKEYYIRCCEVSETDLMRPEPFEQWEADRLQFINDTYKNKIDELNNKIDKCKDNYKKLLQTYDYYEIQPHVKSLEQIQYNKMLYEASKQYNKPLIAGTDTHSINKYKAECRSILQKAKKIEFSNEDEFDLTYKSYDELVEMFQQQGSLPMAVILEAIENTNVMADSIEDFVLDTSFKYPVLYDNEEKVFKKRINDMYQDKLKRGIIQPDPRYKQMINEEMRVFKKIGMVGFMLFMSELVCWCWENNIPVGFCRGSVGGSMIAYITDIIDVNPLTWNTVFSRFANEDRKEIGDIDLDISPSQRHLVYEHIIEKFGSDKTAYVLAIGTISDKGTIDEIGRALSDKWLEVNSDRPSTENPYSLDNIARIKKEYEVDPDQTKERYSDIFYYFDGLVDTAISQSMHPAGIICSPVTLIDNYGTFWNDGKRILSINMEEIHEISLVKYDLLGLKNIEIIKDCCELVGIKYPKSHEINWEDQNVWEHIIDSPVGIFQFESNFAFDSLKKMGCKQVNDLSLVNASIRPSGESYRDRLLAREENKNPSELIDELLKDNHGFLVFQEDTIKFLTEICGLNGSEADNIRRAIGRKQRDRLEEALPRILEGYCSKSDKPREESEKEAKVFLQIIEDSSNYQFGYNHSTGYSMIGYLCSYLRHYYPKEFITAYLNNANNEDDINMGTVLAKQLGITIHSIKFRYSIAKYSCNNNGIYKGIESIKFCNQKIADELYELRDNKYESFIDLLIDIQQKTTVNSRQLEILIKLNFFQEFGHPNKLLQQVELFNILYGKKQFKKDKLAALGLNEDVVRKYAEKETEKMFTKVNTHLLLKDIIYNYEYKETSIYNYMDYELECLGYISYIDPSADKRLYFVTNVDKKKTLTNIKLHEIYSGKTREVKMWASQYNNNPIFEKDLLFISSLKKENKKEPTGEINPNTGKKIYRPVPGKYEYWLKGYIKKEE